MLIGRSSIRRAKTVLVVDDDEAICSAMRDALERHGYRVLSARNGVEALSVLGGTRVNLIVLDLMMPGMSGWEVLTAQAGDPKMCGTPVLIVSALRDVSEPSHLGVVRLALQKPFRLHELLDAVARYADDSEPSSPDLF
jgi:two-component system response regulator FlrC